MSRKYGEGFQQPIDFFTGQKYGNPERSYGRYARNGQGYVHGRVEILPENTPRPQDQPQDAKGTDRAE